jgi:hypothetical protein
MMVTSFPIKIYTHKGIPWNLERTRQKCILGLRVNAHFLSNKTLCV